MKRKIIVLALLFSQVTFADQSGVLSNESRAVISEDVLRTNVALKSFKEDYLKQPQNKAFAQSPDGVWAWRSDRITVEMAKEDALAACNRSLKKNEMPCEIVNVNDEWIAPKK